MCSAVYPPASLHPIKSTVPTRVHAAYLLASLQCCLKLTAFGVKLLISVHFFSFYPGGVFPQVLSNRLQVAGTISSLSSKALSCQQEYVWLSWGTLGCTFSFLFCCQLGYVQRNAVFHVLHLRNSAWLHALSLDHPVEAQ